MGKFYEERGRAGDDALALDQFLIAQGIAEELYKRSPMTSEPMRDLAFVLEKVGGHNVGIGTPQSLALAIRPLSKAVRFREMLAKWQSDESEKTALAHSLGLLGDYYLACGEPDKLDKALKFFIEATKLCQEVLATTPNYPDASQTLLSLENWISEFYRRRDTPGDSEHGRVH